MEAGTILDRILEATREEVAQEERRFPLASLRGAAEETRPERRPFRRALAEGAARGWVSIIAEIKRASPSRGLLWKGDDTLRLATVYQEAGAKAISLVTEKRFFGGDPRQLPRLREMTCLPVLRKDFIVSEYQVYQTALLGADAVLLIAAALSPSQLRDLHVLCRELRLEALVEVRDRAELDMALELGAQTIGINNRDLRTFALDFTVSERLAPLCPPQVVVVAESGIQDRAHLSRLNSRGVKAALVGERLLTAADPGAALRELAAPVEPAGGGPC